LHERIPNMRALLIFFTSLLAAAVIATTACESLYDDFIPESGRNYIYLFRTENTHDGNLGGRAGADALCASTYTSWYGHLEAQHVRAFLNVSPFDTTQKMPENYGVPADAPVMAVNSSTRLPSAVVADYWIDLFDLSIYTTLGPGGAGVFTGGGDAYWTGDTNGLGMTDTNGNSHCNGWTDNSAAYNGVRGNSSNTDRAWLDWDNRVCSDNVNNRLLCIAW
jgi:hypothetical protein